MAVQTIQSSEATMSMRPPQNAQSPTKSLQVTVTPRNARRESSTPRPAQAAELRDYQLGDCLGKGAFGSVYRALNMGTGETVAVKQIKLGDLKKSELRVITSEIDLLKGLDHPNIVKYHGFVKTAESLNIILEFCENGSLHSISKNFGKFPENLVGLYMSQVLRGLYYLHEQGVIHRDIKGANILTTKQGMVKLADFGVATRTATAVHESNESNVVGTPYWMAPEVIEMSTSPTPASDIWSLGCTVIELLDGKPPYHKVQPMHALFCIVNDEHPPLPETASAAARDFLMQCFQKDPYLRVSARKLLKHAWIVNSRRSDSMVPEEAIKSVQHYNEALKSPNAGSLRRAARPTSASPIPGWQARPYSLATPARGPLDLSKPQDITDQFRSPDSMHEDNWDDDFASAISPSALHLPHLRPHDHFGGMLSSEKLRAYASIDTVAEEGNLENTFKGESTARGLTQTKSADPLETIRPYYLARASTDTVQQKSPMKSPKKKTETPKPKTTPSRSNLTAKKPKAAVKERSRPISTFVENQEDDYSDLLFNDGAFDSRLILNKKKLPVSPSFNPLPTLKTSQSRRVLTPIKHGESLRRPPPTRHPQMRRTRSSIEIQRYAESEQDEDFSDMFSKVTTVSEKQESDKGSEPGTLMLNSKLSVNSWLGDDDDDDDPFAQLEEGFDEADLEANVTREKFARVCTSVEALVGSLKVSQSEEVLADLCEELLEIVTQLPETKAVIVNAHGMLPLLEILETCRRRDVILDLLKVINAIVLPDVQLQENVCFLGGVAIIAQYASRKYPNDIRVEAASFVEAMCYSSTLGLQMFVSAGGLKVLVEFLEEDYEDERRLVLIGVNGVSCVFDCQGPVPKNDFCRILSRSSVLDPLSLVLSRVLDEKSDEYEGKIVNIFHIFSQAENHVKESVADRTVLHRVLKEIKRMSPLHQITMLKFIKNLSMLSTTLDALQNSNAIDVLTELLRSSFQVSHCREVQNQVLNTIYNLCRLSKSRQEDAALNGIIPILLKILKTQRPLKEFVLPILCDMAHSGKVGRRELWRNKGLTFYISLLSDPYWQVTALDAIFTWLQEETAKVEEHLLDGAFTTAIVQCFTTSKANSFENLLEPLQKLLRLSPPVAHSLAHPELFHRISQKLRSNKAVVRLNLLRIVRSICDASDEQGALINVYGLYDSITRLAEYDQAVLVRNMAAELIKSCEAYEKLGKSGGKRKTGRRTSTSLTPPSAVGSISMPPTPTSVMTSGSSHYFVEKESRQRSAINDVTAFRLGKEDSPVPSSPINRPGSAQKSRLPRTTSGRSSRQSLVASRTSPEKEKMPPPARASTTSSATPLATPNSRRRRQFSGDGRWA